MKKRIYRAKSVKEVDLEALGAALEGADRLVMGSDIGKEEMFGALMVDSQSVWSTLKWSALEDSPRLVRWLASLPVGKVEVAMEPSGTYGDVLRYQLEEAGVEVHRVSPKRVKDSREVYDGVPSSHDAKSAAIVGWLHWQGRSERWCERSEEERELTSAVATMVLYDRPFQQCQNRLEARLARHWPELPQWLELDSATLLELLAEFGDPAAVAAEPERARAWMRRVGGPMLKSEKIEAVVSSARQTLGVPMVCGERQALQTLAAEARRLNADAVIGVRFMTSSMLQGAAELLAYGTAVRLAERDG